MKQKFIELTNEYGTVFFLSVDKIITIADWLPNGSLIDIGDKTYHVTDSPVEILEKIKNHFI